MSRESSIQIGSTRNYDGSLSEASSRGYVEQVPAMKPHRWAPRREWYREKETGEIYCLDAPEEKSGGWWARVDSENIVGPNERIH
jgi:hypothetical protein